MKNLMKPIFSLLVVAFVLASCSKEKQIERRLTKKTGDWDVTSYKVTSYEDGISTGVFNLGALGTMTFDDGGAVTWVISFLGTTETEVGTWSNTEDKLTMTIDGDAMVFDIIESSKKEMTLQTSETYSSGGVVYKDDTELVITRKK